jgi:hypothetical protein
MSVGQQAAVLKLISLRSKQLDTPDGAGSVAAACEALFAADRPDPELHALSGYDFQNIVTFLNHHRDVLGQRRLVTIEWQLLPSLGLEPDAPALHEALTEDPAFFAERGLLAQGDNEIGKVLDHALSDPDGTAPPRAVRDLLERLHSDEIDEGLLCGIYTRRGVTCRGLLDGGTQEHALATTFREQAAGTADWSRTRQILRNLAEGYEQEARRHDGEAEYRRRGLDG